MVVQASYKHRFRDMGSISFGLYYQDMAITSLHSKFLPDAVDTSYRLSKKCNFVTNNPVIPATMDTISEKDMCIHAALNGSFGAIHKGLSPEEQAKQVNRVKRHKAGYMPDPVTLPPTAKVSEAVAIRRTLGYKTIPIVDEEGILKGVLKAENYSQRYHLGDVVEEYMFSGDEFITAGLDIDSDEAYNMMVNARTSYLFHVDKQGKLRGMSARTDMESTEYPCSTKDKKGRLVCGASVGGPGKDLEERLKLLLENNVDILFMDTAQGDSEGGKYTVKTVKDYWDGPLVVGNIDNAKSMERLADWEVDIAKVGISPGSICTTGEKIGAGNPQASAVWEVVEVAKQSGISVIADGGLKDNGDVAKALAAGAKAVMSGHFFRATDETPGEIKIIKDQFDIDVRCKEYSGMASPEALRRSGGGRYYQEDVPLHKIAVQGVSHLVPCRGPVDPIFSELLADLKYGMAVHFDSETIDDLSTHPELEFTIKRI